MQPTPPPNVPAPTFATGPRYVDATDRARWAARWLWFVGAVLVAQLAEYLYLASRYSLGSDLTPDSQDAGIEWLDLTLSFLVFVAIIGSMVTFIRWMHRAHANIRALGFTPRFGDGQTIWTWFVPILDFWRPKQLANDIWRSGDTTPTAQVRPFAELPTPGWLLAWWLLFILPVGGASSTDDTLSGWIAFAVTMAPAAYLAARFVAEATERQGARHAQQTSDLQHLPRPSGPRVTGPFV